MKIGAEDPKKVGLLVALMLAAGVVFYINSGSDAPSPSSGSASAAVTQPPQPTIAPLPGRPATTTRGRTISRRATGDTFKPRIGVRPEEAQDLAKIDPTLRLDLLAKVQGVDREGAGRNLFQFGTAPPPPAPPTEKVTLKPGQPGAATAASAKPVELPKGPPPPPQAPPIPLKFYGFSEPRTQGMKRAFFLEGEEIHVGAEGDTILKRYKVIRITPGSVVMEDTQFKQQQTLVIQQEVG